MGNNILAESHIRYGGYGGIAYRHISDTYIALFSHFIPCGVWEAVYIIEGLLKNDSDIKPDTIHADTQDQSLPVFGLAALLGFDLMPRIRNWADLNFYRPATTARYEHIDSLFGDNVIGWGLIETHWTDLLRTAISIAQGRLSSVTLLRRLGNNSHKNRPYRAFRELGRVIRTITLLRYLSDPGLREQITAITNKAEAFHGSPASTTTQGAQPNDKDLPGEPTDHALGRSRVRRSTTGGGVPKLTGRRRIPRADRATESRCETVRRCLPRFGGGRSTAAPVARRLRAAPAPEGPTTHQRSHQLAPSVQSGASRPYGLADTL